MESRSRPIGELVNRSSFPRPRGVPRAPQSAYVQDSHLPVNNQPLAAITSETYATYFRWIAKLTRVHRITCSIFSLHRYASSLTNFIYFIL